MPTFNELGLSPEVLQGVEPLGFTHPTPVQENIIPLVLETPNDIVGLAQTGTGKTAAFGLPLLEQINPHNRNTQVLILAPTRELCMQITADLQNYAAALNELRIVSVYGGASIEKQIKALKKGAHIIAATPGRMLDLLKRKAATIEEIGTVVLDEADEMLNMGFREELDGILENTPAEKRTLLFSATMPKEVEHIAKRYMTNPTRVTIGKQNTGAANVAHQYYVVNPRDRYAALKRLANNTPAIYGIVFCRTRAETKEVAENLISDGYNAEALHGDLSQAQRDKVMKRFRERKLQMLVATDVAARGIDVNDISHVINYNLPDELELYTHRIGRTGRANKSGIAFSIITPREVSKIRRLESFAGKKIEKRQVPNGQEIRHAQVLNLVQEMEQTQVNESQIAPFMESINGKFEGFSKEQLIKHFVSLHFNQFLNDYNDTADLNATEKNRPEKDSKNGKKRNGQTTKNGRKDFERFFINMGKKDGMDPKSLIGVINDHTRDRDIRIGEIDIKGSFSFFEVSKRHSGKVQNALQHNPYKGRPMKIEVAEKQPQGRKNGKRTK